MNWTALGEGVTDTLQALTLVLMLVSLGLVLKAVHRLSHAVSLLAASRMTESLAQQTAHVERETRDQRRRLRFKRQTRVATARLEADPAALRDYRDEAQQLAEIDTEPNDE